MDAPDTPRDDAPDDKRLVWIIENTLQVRVRDLAIELLHEARRADQPARPAPAVTVPDALHEAQLSDACMSYRHDYGLMDANEREIMRGQAAEWWRCLRRSVVEPNDSGEARPRGGSSMRPIDQLLHDALSGAFDKTAHTPPQFTRLIGRLHQMGLPHASFVAALHHGRLADEIIDHIANQEAGRP